MWAMLTSVLRCCLISWVEMHNCMRTSISLAVWYKKEERAKQRDGAFLVRIELLNPNRSLDPEQISLDCWADCLPWVRRRSGLRRERARNKMPTRKRKMTGSYLLTNELQYNGQWPIGVKTSDGVLLLLCKVRNYEFQDLSFEVTCAFQGEDQRALIVHLRRCIGIGSGTGCPCIDLRATHGERVERLAEFAVYE